MSDKAHAVARIQVVVEVPVSSWGAECTVQQVFDQSVETARGAVGKVCSEKGWRLVGEAKVTAVLAERA